MAAFNTLIIATTMICNFGQSTQEGHLFGVGGGISGPEARPSWPGDILGDRPPHAPIDGHNRPGKLTSNW